MVAHLDIAPELYRWAVRRAGWDEQTALQKFPHLEEWTAGTRKPTLKQAEQFAHATHAPFGQLFLSAPPDEPIPVPDLRTFDDASLQRPSADLLDTIHLCQERQDWYRDYASENGLDPVPYIGSAATGDDPAQVAERMRGVLDGPDPARDVPTSWSARFRALVDRIEATGALVMVSGIVGTNTHRVLRPEEFRGFALSDDLAPLLFINAADTKAAQVFTLIHELAHLWLDGSALSDADVTGRSANATERWCNAVAAEFLVPAHEARGDRVGGDDCNTQPLRLSRQFARSVIESAHVGSTSYRDAYQLLGTSKHSTFEGLAEQLGAR